MDPFASMAIYLVIFSFFVFVLLLGPTNKFRHGPIGRLHQFLTSGLIEWIVIASKRICGNRVARPCEGIYSYFMERKNPVLQLTYLLLLSGAIYIFYITGWQHIPGPYLSTVHLYTVPLVILFTYSSLIIASWSDPGRISRENALHATKIFEYDFLLFEPKTCRTCLLQKPARSKHCSLCKMCVAKSDHHCAWINNCVGFNNHRYFMMFLYATIQICFYGAYLVVCIFFGIAKKKNLSSAFIIDHYTRKRVPITVYQSALYLIHQERLLGSLGVFAFLVGVVVFVFLCYQLHLIYCGTTTNEGFKWEDLEEIILAGELYYYEKELIDKDDNDKNKGKKGKGPRGRKTIVIYWSETEQQRKERLKGAGRSEQESPAGTQVRTLREIREMANETTSKTFLAEISALYQSNDKAEREQANAWLQSFQKTPEAWAIADQMLRMPEVSAEAHYIAARTFRSKITYDLHQLDANARVSLRDSLLDLLYQYRAAPRYIITQICLSIAALAIQMLEWQDVLPQLAGLFGKDSETIRCLLEFLKVLPEEVNENHRIPISEDDYRTRSKQLLTNNAEEVLQMLLICLQSSGSNTEYQKKVFEVLLSWLYSGDIPINLLANNPLLALSFDALQSEELFDVAVDVVCQIIQASQDIPDSMPAIEQIYPRLLPLREALKRAAEAEDEEDQVRGFCRIFTHAGESYLPLVLLHAEAFRSIVEAISDCTAYHDTEIVRITFSFWHRLADTLFEPRHAEIKHKFYDIYANLVDLVIQHLHYPKDDESWNAQRRDEFREFRHIMGDVLKDCCVLLGTKKCLSKPYITLSTQLSNTASGIKVDWQDIEAPLFSLRAMGSEVDEEENAVLPQIMQLIPQLPNHPKIRYAATLVISRYSYWTRRHPEFIPYQLTFISSGFDNEEVAAAAALALKFLCKDCSALLVEFLPQLHPFYLNVTTTLHGTDLIEVTEAVAHVVAAVPPTQLLSALQMFCLPIAQRLAEIANLGTAATETNIREACEKTDQLTITFRVIADRRNENKSQQIISTGQVHPCISVIQEMWPVFDQLLAHFSGHPHLSEAISKCFKNCVVSYSDEFRPLLPALMDRLVNAFDQTGLSCYLWVATKCVREYIDGEGSEATLTLLAFVERLSVTMFRVLAKKKFVDIPDVIEDYFRLNNAFVECAPATFVQSSILTPIFQAGLQSLVLQQQDALYAVLIFFSRLLTYGVSLGEVKPSTSTPSVSSARSQSVNSNANRITLEVLIRQLGLELVNRMLDGLLNTFSRDIQVDVDNIFKSLAKILPIESQQWMAEVVQTLPENGVTQNDRTGFISDYSRAIQEGDWSKQRRVLNDFIAVYRRRQYSSRRLENQNFAE
ncbi:hypothetical protein G9A89_020710 [Geosiphon pyriformis]|nr:hypothetical protein G9A89_020710 [Geosiphon pyriformis]